MRRNKPKKAPPDIQSILEEGRKRRGISTGVEFGILPLTNEFRPKKLPEKSGSKIIISAGFPPRAEEINIIREIEDQVANVTVVRWIPSYRFYVSQIVIFSVNGKQYTYQIKPTTMKNSGEFVFLREDDLEQYPGSAARTSSGGGSKSRYSR